MAQDPLDAELFAGLGDLLPPFTEEPEVITSGDIGYAPAVLDSAAVSHTSGVSTPESVPSPSSSSSSSSSASEPTPVEELLMLIDWKNAGEERPGPKRTRGPHDKAHEKHVLMEKKRRGDLTQAIEEINSLVPPVPAAAEKAAKRTKVTTLQDAAEYLKRLQDVACQLLQENKRLTATLQDQPLLLNTTQRQRPALQGQDVVRLFMITGFILWMFLGVPTPWSSGQSSSTSFSSRAILNVNAVDNAHEACRGIVMYVYDKVWQLGTIIAMFLFVYVCILLQDMPRISEEQLHRAEMLLREATTVVDRDSNWVLAQAKHAEAMHALNKSLPTSKLAQFLFMDIQIIRAVLNMLVIGVWIERLLHCILGRQAVALVEAKAYMFGARLGRVKLEKRSSPMLFYGCILYCASSLNSGNAPFSSRDEFGVNMVVFMSDGPRTKRRVHLLFSTLIVALAEGQVFGNHIRPDPNEELSEWSVLRMLAEPTQRGKLEEGFNVAMSLVPTLKGYSQHKALGSAGLILFCLRRYHGAFILLTTALRSKPDRSSIVRVASSSVLMCLYRLGMKDEGRKLLPLLEGSYLAVPNARANLLPVERSLFFTCKVIYSEDYPSLVANVRELIAVIDNMGMQRYFVLPHMIELALERVLEALALANNPHARKTEPAVAYVVHQRGELKDLADTLITLLKRCAYWGALSHPIMERANGHLAHVCGDASAASYHLNRSILEARRWKLEVEEARTQELMQLLGVPIMGMDQKTCGTEKKKCFGLAAQEEEKVGAAAV